MPRINLDDENYKILESDALTIKQMGEVTITDEEDTKKKDITTSINSGLKKAKKVEELTFTVPINNIFYINYQKIAQGGYFA